MNGLQFEKNVIPENNGHNVLTTLLITKSEINKIEGTKRLIK